jgi:uncharacterized protein DUF6766
MTRTLKVRLPSQGVAVVSPGGIGKAPAAAPPVPAKSALLMWWKDHSLSVVLLALFLLSMTGQLLTGWHEHNSDSADHGQPVVSLGQYVWSGHFWEATGENWESEFLQMAMFVMLTCHLRQKGSAESKRIDAVEDVDLDPRRFAHDPEAPGPVRRGGWRLRLYANSLAIAFGVLFVFSFALHAAGGFEEFNQELTAHHHPRVPFREYVVSSRLWFESFQNWQSEFLSLAAMVIGTIYLRQHGSAESKPVHAPYAHTGR